MRCDECNGALPTTEPGKGSDPYDDTEDQTDGAEHPDPRVAEDLEGSLPIVGAAEGIERVGETIFMECSGDDDTCDYSHGGSEDRWSSYEGDRIYACNGQPNDGSYDGEPHECPSGKAAIADANRGTREEAHCGS